MDSSILKRTAFGALAILAAALLGCGSDSDDTSTTGEDSPAVKAQQQEVEEASKITTPIDAADVVKAFPPTVVTDGDVDAEKEGTAERALLEWWQAFQFHDVRVVDSLTSKTTQDAVGSGQLEELVRVATLPGIEIMNVNESGSSATINAGLLTFTPDKSGEVPNKPTQSTPVTFAMSEENGNWVYDETPYLELRLASINR